MVAFSWFEKSANQGNADAMAMLGYFYLHDDFIYQDITKGKSLIQQSIDAGSAYGLMIKGIIHYEAIGGTQQDHQKAKEWTQKAANLGNARAQDQLGVMYRDGIGTPIDYQQALYWYTKSAEQGFAAAQNNIGHLYHNGYGVQQSTDKAIEWYEKAAKQGYTLAQYNLGLIYAQDDGVRQDYQKAVEWYTKAANQGNAYAQADLGNMRHYVAPAQELPHKSSQTAAFMCEFA